MTARREHRLKPGDVVVAVRWSLNFPEGSIGILVERQDMYGYLGWLVDDGYEVGPVYGVPECSLQLLERPRRNHK